MKLSATAQRPVDQTAIAPPAPPRLIATAGQHSVEMLLTELRADVEIAGLSAEVTLYLTFHNPHKRELQGELLFPLPDGATVCGYGLDIGGELADASLVERHHARRAFEAEVRQVPVIDPGLVEHVRGNVFRTRIYPLPARGNRQIKLQYVTSLKVSEGSAQLDLPLATTGQLQKFQARVVVVGVAEAGLSGSAWEDVGFEAKGDRLVAEVIRHNVEPQVIRVVLPCAPATAATVEQTEAGERYFVLHHVAPADSQPRDPAEAVQSMRLLWGASLSRASVDLQAEFDVLRRVMARLRDVDVEVVTFRFDRDPPRTFRVTGGDSTALLDHLRHLPYDGGTRLASVIGLLKEENDHAYTLLCSDGISTLDENEDLLANDNRSAKWRTAAPVFAMVSARHANYSLLRHLAALSGGTVIDLSVLDISNAAEHVGRRPYSLLSVEVTDGDVRDMLPPVPAPAFGVIRVTGRLTSSQAMLRLNLGYPGPIGQHEVVERIDLALDGSAAAVGRVVPRLWAQERVAALAVSGRTYGSQMLELGRKFGLVTPGTSLLVLESLWQHLEHDVEPAQTRTKLLQSYHAALADRQPTNQELPPGPGLQPNLIDLTTRNELLRFYARLKIGGAEDLAWAADVTEGMTAAQVVELVDGAIFLARSTGRPTVERQDLHESAHRILRRSLVEPNRLQRYWRSRVAWWQRSYPAPSDVRVATIAPDKAWWQGIGTTSFASRSKSIDANSLSADMSAMDMTMDRSLDLKREDSDGTGQTFGGVVMQHTPQQPGATTSPWRSENLPKLDALAGERAVEREYLRLRALHAVDPHFYVDWAVAHFAQGQQQLGVRALSNLAEVALDDAEHLRMLGYYAEANGADDLAGAAYNRVLQLRPEEPQSHRDLALVLARRGETGRAINLLLSVVHGRWDPRFQAVVATALMELNSIFARDRHDQEGDHLGVSLPESLSQTLDVDLRVVLDWNTDNTDLDLWVVEPTGELCAFPGGAEDRASKIGGLVPSDLQSGYGPEEYLIHRAPPGVYKLRIRHAGDTRRRAGRWSTAKLTIIHDFGRPSERREIRVLQVPFHEPPTFTSEGGTTGCGLGFTGALLFSAGVATRTYWLAAVAVVVWAAAIGWTKYASRTARSYRVEKNAVDAGEVTVPTQASRVSDTFKSSNTQ